MAGLAVDWCSHEAADYAVMTWHYSRTMPSGKLVKIGVWEDDLFIGAVLFGRGASPNLGKAYGLNQSQCCELVRVALDKHQAPVTQIVATSIRLLTRQSSGLRLIVSFADPLQGHVGRVYQAGNWIYAGQSAEVSEYYLDGRWRHTRSVWHDPRRPQSRARVVGGKHRYLMPLDRGMRRQIGPLGLPYPRG